METDRLPPWLGGIGVDEALKIGWMLEIPLRIAKIEDALFVTLAQVATSEERSDHLCLTSSKLSMFHAGLAREFAEFSGLSTPIGLELPDAGRPRLDDSIRAIGKIADLEELDILGVLDGVVNPAVTAALAQIESLNAKAASGNLVRLCRSARQNYQECIELTDGCRRNLNSTILEGFSALNGGIVL
ncbi:MAG: hypothetical protein HKL81_03275 [Acidimicrobiaceae bacterium]|nr:hypothetical protein [Acidimicrobiaceae bacterium]